MSDRRKKSAGKNKIIGYGAAFLIHAAIVVVLVFKFTSEPTKIEAHDADIIDVVKATTIDESQIKHQQNLIKQKELDKKRQEDREKKRLAELKEQAEQEKKLIDDLKEKQAQEQEKALKLEAERKEIALKKEKEIAEREKEKKKREKEKAEEKKRLAKEKAEKEKQKKAEAQRKKQLELKKQKLELEKKQKEIEEQKKRDAEKARLKKEADELAAQKKAAQESLSGLLAAEEAKQRTTTVMGKHAALVRDAINAKRTIAPDFDSWLVAKLNIELSETGDVKSVSVARTSGNERYDRDAEKAVWNASPLPIPSLDDDEAAHSAFRDMVLTVKMPGA